MENNELMQRVTITKNDEVEGVYYFETEEEARKFANDVAVFQQAIKVKDDAIKEKIMKRYSRNKAYANFLKAFEMKLVYENVIEEVHD